MTSQKEITEACETIDAAMFSGDTFHEPSRRAELRSYLGRWDRELKQLETLPTKIRWTGPRPQWGEPRDFGTGRPYWFQKIQGLDIPTEFCRSQLLTINGPEYGRVLMARAFRHARDYLVGDITRIAVNFNLEIEEIFIAERSARYPSPSGWESVEAGYRIFVKWRRSA